AYGAAGRLEYLLIPIVFGVGSALDGGTLLTTIVMTTMCFVHMVPPYFASGAGAEMRRSVCTAMLWGAFGGTLFGIFLTPVFFYVIRRFARQPPSTGGRT